MNRMLATAVSVIVWSSLLLATGFGAGWLWRGDRAEAADAVKLVSSTTQALQQERKVRATEHAQADAMATIGEDHEKDRAAAEAVPDAVVADLRAGNLRLRDGLATCSTSLLSQAVTGAVERDAHAQLRGEVAGAVVQVGRDADNHVRACQAVIAADRSAAASTETIP